MVVYQFKYIDEGDFKDLKRLTKLHLDGNQVGVIAEAILTTQRSLEFLGKWTLFI